MVQPQPGFANRSVGVGWQWLNVGYHGHVSHFPDVDVSSVVCLGLVDQSPVGRLFIDRLVAGCNSWSNLKGHARRTEEAIFDMPPPINVPR